MTSKPPTLGTLLRHLLDLLDEDVEAVYRGLGLDYRPRFTPIVRVLMDAGPSSIRSIAQVAGVTHSAASQTVAEMSKRGLVETAPGKDARDRVVSLAPKALKMMPQLKSCWDATNAAAAELDRDLGIELGAVLGHAVAELERRPYLDRISAQRAAASTGPPEASPPPSPERMRSDRA